MGTTGRVSLPAFITGVVCAAAVAVVPALAGVVPQDQNPTVFDATTPVLTMQAPQFVLGGIANEEAAPCDDNPTYVNAPLDIRWDAQDAVSGVQSYDIWVASYLDDPLDYLHSSNTTATSFTELHAINYDNRCGEPGYTPTRVWVEAVDYRGARAATAAVDNHSEAWDEAGIDWTTSPTPDLSVTRTGTWSTSTCLCALHRKTTYTSARGASISYTLFVDKPGRAVAVVSPTGSTRGVMSISVDGRPATAVNTYSTGANVNRVIVWQQILGAGQHTIRIVNAATTGHPRIDVDAVMLGPAVSGEAPRLRYPTS